MQGIEETKKKSSVIDFVIAWVDMNDPEWRATKACYDGTVADKDTENSDARYRDWGILRYWFRAVEKYAPWVNKIWFVTAGSVPAWLNVNHEKLQIVRHEEFIPPEYLPTFSSHPIELNFFRIQGLAEQFVYFNDDMFLMGPAVPEDFFKDGLPCDEALLNVHCPLESKIIHTIAANDAGVINEHFTMRDVLKRDTMKWFHPVYGIKNLLQNLILSKCPRFPGFKQFHCPAPLLKSVCQAVWEHDDSPAFTSTHKFREKVDINQWVFREWAMAEGKFIPYPVHRKTRFVAFDQMTYETALQKLEAVFADPECIMACINDFDHEGDDFDLDRAIHDVQQLFEQRLPEKSGYEWD